MQEGITGEHYPPSRGPFLLVDHPWCVHRDRVYLHIEKRKIPHFLGGLGRTTGLYSDNHHAQIHNCRNLLSEEGDCCVLLLSGERGRRLMRMRDAHHGSLQRLILHESFAGHLPSHQRLNWYSLHEKRLRGGEFDVEKAYDVIRQYHVVEDYDHVKDYHVVKDSDFAQVLWMCEGWYVVEITTLRSFNIGGDCRGLRRCRGSWDCVKGHEAEEDCGVVEEGVTCPGHGYKVRDGDVENKARSRDGQGE